MSLLERIRARRRVQRLEAALDHLVHMMGARTAEDDQGLFVRGFGSQAIAARAEESPPFETWRWLESEAAKLILGVVSEDKAGDRSLLRFRDDDCGVEDEIIRRAKAKAVSWARERLLPDSGIAEWRVDAALGQVGAVIAAAPDAALSPCPPETPTPAAPR